MGALTWIKNAASIGTGGLSSLYLYGGLLAAGAALSTGAYLWHGRQVDGLHDEAYAAGQAEVQARWDAAREQATDTQAGQNTEATKEVIVTETVTQTQYRDRIKEVIRYVPKPDTVCPADPEFVRLFNGTN